MKIQGKILPCHITSILFTYKRDFICSCLRKPKPYALNRCLQNKYAPKAIYNFSRCVSKLDMTPHMWLLQLLIPIPLFSFTKIKYNLLLIMPCWVTSMLNNHLLPNLFKIYCISITILLSVSSHFNTDSCNYITTV